MRNGGGSGRPEGRPGEERPHGSAGKDFLRGVRDALPIFLGYFSASVAFGLLARGTGLGLGHTQAFSLITFTGAAQFMALNLIAAGAGPGELVLSYMLVNLRYFLMSASTAPRVRTRTHGQRFALAFGITDENFALTASQDRPVSASWQAAVELTPWVGWNTGTLIGWLFGSVLPPSVQSAMGISLYALFMALLVPEIRRGWRPAAVAALGGGLNSLFVLVLEWPTGWSFVIAMIGATLMGMLLLRSGEAAA